MVSVPTQGEVYSRLIERLILVQEDCAMMAHLTRAQGTHKDHALADGWISIEELLKRLNWKLTQLAQGKLQ